MTIVCKNILVIPLRITKLRFHLFLQALGSQRTTIARYVPKAKSPGLQEIRVAAAGKNKLFGICTNIIIIRLLRGRFLAI